MTEASLTFSFADLNASNGLSDLKAKRAPVKAVKPEFKSYSGKVWRERPLAQSVLAGLLDTNMPPHLAEIYARRIDELAVAKAGISPKLGELDSPYLLPDIITGVNLLNDAIENKGRIALVCDFDADGMNSAAVLYGSLTQYFGVDKDLVDLYIGQRLVEGYGLSDLLVDRILESGKKPDVVVTADCGSSDEPRIARLAEMGIKTVVTDHHTLPVDGHPKSAAACITPLREDSEYPDAKIAGCMVAWLTMSALRGKLIQAGKLPESAPTLKGLLDFVALATVADCVSLGDSKNNRAVVNYGLMLINNGSRPCWRAFRDYVGGHDVPITSETLAFAIAPRLNARGRLSDAVTGVDFLLSDNDMLAEEFARLLDGENSARKQVEKEMCLVAIEDALKQVSNKHDGIVVYLEEGHPGVHGIVASRVTERTGKPSIMLSPMVGNRCENDVILSGSCRSVGGVDVRQALQYVADLHPGIFVKFGGHAGAAGLTTHLSKLDTLQKAFNEAVKAQAKGRTLLPVVHTDGSLEPKHISLDFIDTIMRGAPYGRGFEFPVYEGDFTIDAMRPIGADKTHLKLTLSNGKYRFSAVWFGVRETVEDDIPVVEGASYRFAYNVSENVYRGTSSVQLMVNDVMDRGVR